MTNRTTPRRWGRAIVWFVGSVSVTFAALVFVVARIELIMRARHTPMITDPGAAVALFIVLMAPSTVVMGSLIALRGSPLRWRRRGRIVAAALIAGNLVIAALGVANEMRDPVPPSSLSDPIETEAPAIIE